MVASGLSSRPRLYVVEDPQPNAFATGRNPENAVICVTTGLLEKLDYYELEGVIAHEMSHIKNYDIRLSCIVSVMVGFIVMIADLFSRMLFWGGLNDRDNDNKANGILMLIGLVFLILSPIFGSLMQLALSRKREFLADATAVEFTQLQIVQQPICISLIHLGKILKRVKKEQQVYGQHIQVQQIELKH